MLPSAHPLPTLKAQVFEKQVYKKAHISTRPSIYQTTTTTYINDENVSFAWCSSLSIPISICL